MREETRNLTRRTTAPAENAVAPAPPGNPSLRAEVSGWHQVAREAFESLQRGADAELELALRRNDSGQ